MTKPLIVFFGSGPVAAKSLKLLSKHCQVEAIITKPKPGSHKGDFPVIDVAEDLKIATNYVSNKLELNSLIKNARFNSKLGVIIDFGIIVSQSVIDYFPLGIVNSHFSLLPQLRGADPITFAILSGQQKTGVSLMLIDAGMDTGKLITQESINIGVGVTTPELTEKLILLSDKLLMNYLPKYISGEVKPYTQHNPKQATYSRKLTKEDGVIDWNKPAEQIEREIRAYIEWPQSRSIIATKDVIITQASVLNRQLEPGKIIIENKSIIIGCNKNALQIERLRPAGKKEMTAEGFLAGYARLIY